MNVNHIELAVVFDCEQIHLTAVLRKVLRNNSAPLSASYGSNPAQSPVVIGSNPALLLPINSGCNPATLSALFGHKKAPLSAMIGHNEATLSVISGPKPSPLPVISCFLTFRSRFLSTISFQILATTAEKCKSPKMLDFQIFIGCPGCQIL